MSRLTPATTSKELSPVKAGLKALEQSGALGRALPTGISEDRFARIALTELSKNKDLERCTPQSFLGAVMTAAQLGLEFGPVGHAYLVPFKGKVTLIVGYKGYIDLARRSGKLQSIVARPVHANDQFEFEYGTTEHLTHRPALTGRGPVIAYYGVALLADGGQVIHVMSPEDIDAFRGRSASSKRGPWVTDYDAMACKTVIRRMTPWLPMSVEAAQAVESDEAVLNWDGVEASPALPGGDAIEAPQEPQEAPQATESAPEPDEGITDADLVAADPDDATEGPSADDWRGILTEAHMRLGDLAPIAKEVLGASRVSYDLLGKLEADSAGRLLEAIHAQLEADVPNGEPFE